MSIEQMEYNVDAGYKTYMGHRYHIDFPNEWILNELPETGRNCLNCTGIATWRNIILGYCVNCAKFEYNYTRGRGFLGYGVESQVLYVPSAYNTYLKKIDKNLHQFGNINENPEDTLENHNDFFYHYIEQVDDTDSECSDNDY